MSSIVMDKETIFADEIIRENARLTVQHEADLLKVSQLEEGLASLPSVQEIRQIQERAAATEAKLASLDAMLCQAIEDLHFVMAGGNPCDVCANKCAFGTRECKPVWRREEAVQ